MKVMASQGSGESLFFMLTDRSIAPQAVGEMHGPSLWPFFPVFFLFLSFVSFKHAFLQPKGTGREAKTRQGT